MFPSLSVITQLLVPALFTPNLPHFAGTISSGCPSDLPPSCQDTSASNTCCTESPGGLLLQTQFWDTKVSGSPKDSWTIHGLWPDNCDGTYIENCDPSRDYDIRELLQEQGASSTLDYMQQFWLNSDGTNEHFWNHEWSTHGTCYSTLSPSCLPQDTPNGAEAAVYFENIVQLFQKLPTYQWLANAGIKPTRHHTYTLSEILSALERGSGGFTPAVGCSHDQLNSISWYFNLQGSLIDGQFIPISSPKKSECPHKGIHYVPKED